jgi:pantothenate kinase
MSRKIDFDVPPEIMTKLFDFVSFLETNRDVILADITPKMVKFLEKQAKASGPFKKTYEDNFEKVLLKELRDVVQDHFSVNSEEIAILMDPDLLKLLGITDLYNKKTFYSKENK